MKSTFAAAAFAGIVVANPPPLNKMTNSPSFINYMAI
jgi:hypothetical protein